MISWVKRKWRLWRLTPGLRLAAEMAYDRAWGHKLAGSLGPEKNLLDLSNDLNGYRLRLDR